MMRISCSNCGKHLEAPEEASGKKGRCSGCGEIFVVSDIEEDEILDLEEGNELNKEKTRYPILQTISFMFEIIAWVHFCAAVVLFIFVLVKTPVEIEVQLFSALSIPRGALAIPILFFGAVSFLIYYALAEIIKLFLGIEENTKRAADANEDALETLENLN